MENNALKQQRRLKVSIAFKLIFIVVLFELIIMLVFAKFEAIKQYPILEAFIDTLSLGILIIVAFYFLLNKPLKSILSTISAVQKGNLDAEVKLTSSDEMGYLAKAFNQMIQDLKKQRARLVDKDYVDSIIANMIDLRKYGELWKDVYDGLSARRRANEPTELLDSVRKRLRRQRKPNV